MKLKLNKATIAALLVSFLLLFFAFSRSCGESKRSALLQGRVDALTAENNTYMHLLEQKQADFNTSEKLHNEELAKIRKDVHDSDVDHSSDLYKKAKELEKAEESIVDINELVVNLRAQKVVDKRIIKDLEFKVGEKQRAFDELDAKWIEKEIDWKDLDAAKDKAIEKLKAEITERKNLVVSLKKDVARLQLGSTVKTGVVVGLAAAVVYGLVSK